MLRHAFTVALFPEHQVAAVTAVPNAAAKDFDLVIVDAAALQEENLLSARELDKLKAWKLPVVWFGADGALAQFEGERWLRLDAPLTQEILRRAVAQNLAASVAVQAAVVGETPPLPVHAPAIPTPTTRKKKSAEASAGKNFIELVDIVDDKPA